MMGSDRVLAIIPARGGSKGLPRKNILPLHGKPLIAWSIDAAKASRYIDKTIVSSEDEEIVSVAMRYGGEVPFSRPKVLASDDATTMDVVFHVLETIDELYEWVVLLQPTSPLRNGKDIDACLDLAVQKQAPACVSVCVTEKSPYLAYQLMDNGKLEALMDPSGIRSTRRQLLPTSYVLNGAVYVARVDWLLKSRRFVTEQTLGAVMPKERSPDVDSELDLVLAEATMRYIGMLHGSEDYV